MSALAGMVPRRLAENVLVAMGGFGGGGAPRAEAAGREAGMKIHFVLPQLMPFYGMEKAATQL